MKVGILTFHEIYNPGAFLQTMGSVSLLKSLGHEGVVIDYTPLEHRFSLPRLFLLRHWRLWFRPRTFRELAGRNRAFQRARHHFNKTPKLLTHKDVEQQEFDAVLIGADIVWDYIQPHLGQDPVYFGKYLNTEKIISFAASCGNVPYTNSPPEFVVEGLKKMASISVRDTNTQKMVKEYAHRDSVIICDPAFHYDVSTVTSESPENKPYLLVYAMPQFVTQELIFQTKNYARKHGLITVAVCYRQNWTDKNRICIGPMKWLTYFANAKAVVTNTFHGTVFSVKFGVPFVSVMNSSIRLKTETMAEKISIGDRFWNEENSIEEILDAPWAVSRIHTQIKEWTAEARSFLENTLMS